MRENIDNNFDQLLDLEKQKSMRRNRLLGRAIGIPLLLGAIFIWYYFLKESLHIVPQSKAFMGILIFIISIPVSFYIVTKLEKNNKIPRVRHSIINRRFQLALGLVALVTLAVIYFVYGI